MNNEKRNARRRHLYRVKKVAGAYRTNLRQQWHKILDLGRVANRCPRKRKKFHHLRDHLVLRYAFQRDREISYIRYLKGLRTP